METPFSSALIRSAATQAADFFFYPVELYHKIEISTSFMYISSMPEVDKENRKIELPVKFLKVIESYYRISDLKENDKENDAALATAIWYEKIRAAMEYQESHLMFKNAIYRIIQRNVLLNSKVKADKLLQNMINELVWANYITPKTVDEKISYKLLIILNKYLKINRNASSANYSRAELVKKIMGLCACEMEEEISNKDAELRLLDFIYCAVKNNFDHKDSQISQHDHEIQIVLAIYAHIFKPDRDFLSYLALKLTHANWRDLPAEECIKKAKSIDPFFASFDKQINNPLRNKYLLAVRNMAAPFIVIRTFLLTNHISREWAEKNPTMLEHNLYQAYESLRVQSNLKIWRGIWRALIFILLTKLVLAFIVELPIDRALHGEIVWLPLIANVSFPPLLMFLTGASIPKIPAKNTQPIREAISEIIKKGKLSIEKPYIIEKNKRTRSSIIFNYILTIFSIMLVIAVIYLLRKIGFSAISIILFFIFVSAVSFLSFRIRVNSKELLLKRRGQDSITNLVEFIFLPFITSGKLMSDSLNRLNPILLAVDFVIEAPLKTVIKIFRTWFNFISAKKEELEY